MAQVLWEQQSTPETLEPHQREVLDFVQKCETGPAPLSVVITTKLSTQHVLQLVVVAVADRVAYHKPL